MEEIWRDIEGYEGEYQVSNLGRIMSLKYNKKKILSLKTRKDGYKEVVLSKNNIQKWCYVHRLVAIAFIPNPNNKSDIDHIDTNKSNNCVDNLRWVTKEENMSNEITKKKLPYRLMGEKNPSYNKFGENNAKSIKVVQLNKETYELIRVWGSIVDAKRELKITHISDCCKNKRNHAGGFKWMYYEDYIKQYK